MNPTLCQAFGGNLHEGDSEKYNTCNSSPKYFKAKVNGWCLSPRSMPLFLLLWEFSLLSFVLFPGSQFYCVCGLISLPSVATACQLQEGFFIQPLWNIYENLKITEELNLPLRFYSLAKGFHANSIVMCAKIQISINLIQAFRTVKSRKFSQKQWCYEPK